MYDSSRVCVRPKTTEQNRIVRFGKSEAEVTSNKKLRLRIYTTVLKLTTDRHEVSSGLYATAELLVRLRRKLSNGTNFNDLE